MAWLGAGQSPSSRTAGPQIAHCNFFPMSYQPHQLYTTTSTGILCIHTHIHSAHIMIYTHAYITLMLARRAHCVPPCNCSGDSAARPAFIIITIKSVTPEVERSDHALSILEQALSSLEEKENRSRYRVYRVDGPELLGFHWVPLISVTQSHVAVACQRSRSQSHVTVELCACPWHY